MTTPTQSASKVGCSGCNLREHCLPPGLSARDFELLETLVSSKRVLHRGMPLFHSGDVFDSLYVVRLGCLKSVIASNDGREQVTGFHMIGEVLGLDGLGTKQHTCDVIALEDTELCVISYSQFCEIAQKIPSLHVHLQSKISRKLLHTRKALLMLGSMHASERLASFLLNLSHRYEARGFSRTEFVLRMTRAEMGSYLGLKLETVSRILSRFAKMKLIEINQRHVHILNTEGLRAQLSDAHRMD